MIIDRFHEARLITQNGTGFSVALFPFDDRRIPTSKHFQLIYETLSRLAMVRVFELNQSILRSTI
jgi:hypothetical protein